MTVDPFPGPVVAELADPGARFIRETVLPVEDRHREVVHSEAVRRLDMRGRTVVFEDGHGRCLRPLATGEIRSCFAMTEPAPGAGSDPAAPNTRAERVPGGRRIDGRKWFSTGADGAGFTIVVARTSGEPGERGGATMFFVDADNPGTKSVRHIGTLDENLFGGRQSSSSPARPRRTSPAPPSPSTALCPVTVR